MSIAPVSADLHQFDTTFADEARTRDFCDRFLRPSTIAAPPTRAPVISRKELGTLIVQNMNALERYAWRLTSHRADAQDLVQETCRKALVAHAMFVPGTNVAAWLHRILQNLHRDWVRHGRHEILVAGPCETVVRPSPEDRPYWQRVPDEAIANALGELPPIYRSVYVLRSIEGCSYQQIARKLDIPNGTVGTRLSRARGLIRKALMNTPACE